MELVTEGHEDRLGELAIEEALGKAFDAGLVDQIGDVPDAAELWEQLMKIVNVKV